MNNLQRKNDGFFKMLSFGFIMKLFKPGKDDYIEESREAPVEAPSRTEVARQFFAKYKLTPREKEVIGLVLKGLTNRAIEDKLFISVNTVKCHIYNAYRKIGVRTRLQLMHRFQTAGQR